MKSVSYTSSNKLSCGCNAAVIICLDSDLTASGAPYIEGTVAFSESVINSCGRTSYLYAVTYNEGQLADPEYSLVEADISGIVCRGCLTTYIDYLIGTRQQFKGMGTTAQRPSLLLTDIGATYMDTTLDVDGLPIWWNGIKWIRADGSDA